MLKTPTATPKDGQGGEDCKAKRAGVLLTVYPRQLSTVGPFIRWGEPAAEAAIDARAAYIDSTGEPPFIHKVFTVSSGPRCDPVLSSRSGNSPGKAPL